MNSYKQISKIIIAFIILIIVFILAISIGEAEISFSESIKGLLNIGTNDASKIILELRVPRAVAAIFVGATLAISGSFTRIALRNPLADSGILGVQTGATVVALICILVVPDLFNIMPLLTFAGGLIAFAIVILASYDNGFKPLQLVLAGVAVNAFFAAIVGIITIFNANQLKDALSWLNGSLNGISLNDMNLIVVYSTLALIGAIFFIPTLNLLRLDDDAIINLGKNPNTARLVVSVYGVLLASISISFVGVITFVGIIVPQFSSLIIGHKLKYQIPMTMILGSILILVTDTGQKILFSPMEIPVGIVLGLVGTPTFLFLLRRVKNG